MTNVEIGTLVAEVLKQGTLGLAIAALILGWVIPKWVLDEYRKREAVKASDRMDDA